MKRSIAFSLALLPLAGCSLFTTSEPPFQESEQTSSVAETKNVIYRGLLLPLGASIYMEGTHRLELEDGRFVLLESNGLLLDEYLNMDVEVFGATRPTVEGGGIIMRVERVAQFIISSAPAAEASSSSEQASSVAADLPPAASSAPAVVASRPPVVTPPASSKAPVVAPASSAAPVAVASSSSSAANDAVSLRAATMAKANMAPTNWTQQYCSTHIEFCFPVHKNWYYTSFGATSSSQWHVELSSEELQALGDGPLSVVLHSGALPGPDGQVTTEGGVVTGIRAWTNNRHFVISAPASLDAAVRYITQELRAAPAAAPGAGQ